ncbi:hypothetical protein [Hydrogenophaga sp.]|nr:hypothetical protein [Hydrogenophaga sp.]
MTTPLVRGATSTEKKAFRPLTGRLEVFYTYSIETSADCQQMAPIIIEQM